VPVENVIIPPDSDQVPDCVDVNGDGDAPASVTLPLRVSVNVPSELMTSVPLNSSVLIDALSVVTAGRLPPFTAIRLYVPTFPTSGEVESVHAVITTAATAINKADLIYAPGLVPNNLQQETTRGNKKPLVMVQDEKIPPPYGRGIFVEAGCG
jgi:hypothetical protein